LTYHHIAFVHVLLTWLAGIIRLTFLVLLSGWTPGAVLAANSGEKSEQWALPGLGEQVVVNALKCVEGLVEWGGIATQSAMCVLLCVILVGAVRNQTIRPAGVSLISGVAIAVFSLVAFTLYAISQKRIVTRIYVITLEESSSYALHSAALVVSLVFQVLGVAVVATTRLQQTTLLEASSKNERGKEAARLFSGLLLVFSLFNVPATVSQLVTSHAVQSPWVAFVQAWRHLQGLADSWVVFSVSRHSSGVLLG
jgi:hypothetical protein